MFSTDVQLQTNQMNLLQIYAYAVCTLIYVYIYIICMYNKLTLSLVLSTPLTNTIKPNKRAIERFKCIR